VEDGVVYVGSSDGFLYAILESDLGNLAALVDNHFILVDVGRSHNHHSFKPVVYNLLQVLLIDELREVEFRIDKQVIGFLAKIVKVILY